MPQGSFFETWDYDRWGNRWAQTGAQGGPSPSYSFINPVTNIVDNQIHSSGMGYDAAGNMTNDGAHSYTYDAEGNITAVDGGSTAKYVYNALNQRVESIVGGVINEYEFFFSKYDICGTESYLEMSRCE